MSKLLEVLQAAIALIGALAVFCSILANVLPEGKARTAFSYAGIRLVKAGRIMSGAIPTTPSGVPIEQKADEASAGRPVEPKKGEGAS